MKRVINDLLYDTDTAKVICENSYGSGGDFEREDSALYVTSKGHFFIAGSGGPKSRWGQQTSQNVWSGGEGIRPIDQDEALSYAEAWRADPDVIAEYFGTQAV